MPDDKPFKTALDRAMRYCSRRESCISDVNAKLESWGVSSKNKEKVINVLINEKFIDEQRYATAFVKDKFNFNKWGKLKISAHLKSKNIPGEIIKSALYNIDNELYFQTLKELLSGHKRFIKAKNEYDLKARLLRFGLSRGFESSLIYEVLNDTGL
jgi:regulatory protein